MDASHEPDLRRMLADLQQKHRSLDELITLLEQTAGSDQLHITRLKKQKLQLKDEIARVEDQIFPDIIA